jgi:hypothetical protein
MSEQIPLAEILGLSGDGFSIEGGDDVREYPDEIYQTVEDALYTYIYANGIYFESIDDSIPITISVYKKDNGGYTFLESREIAFGLAVQVPKDH